jgi:hypothetical protein
MYQLQARIGPGAQEATNMPVFDAVICSFFAGGFIAFGLGYLVGRRPLTPDEVWRYMNRVVNLEALDEHEKLTKVRMARNNRKITRTDGGPNARISKMRVKAPKRGAKKLGGAPDKTELF